MSDTGRDRAVLAAGGALLCFAGAAWCLAEWNINADNDATAAAATTYSQVAAALGVMGVGLGVFAITVYVVSVPQVDWQPWISALSKLAAEHGQAVQDDLDRGLWFDTIYGGPRFTVNILPRRGGWVRFHSRRRARHGVAVFRDGNRPTEDHARWSTVLMGKGWHLRAEVAVAAQGLARDATLAEALDAFFADRRARSVIFSGDGLQLELDLPPLADIERRVREALDVARRVWEALEATGA